MERGHIEPHRITKPMQLLAAWLASLVILNTALLTGARFIETPTWAPSVLVITAITNIPIFIECMFIFQTKFRPEMQEDRFYADYLKQKRELANRLLDLMGSAGLNLSDLARGRTLSDVPQEVQQQVRSLLDDLKETIHRLRAESPTVEKKIGPEAILALAQGLMAEGDWLEAGKRFEEYARIRPEDWEANFSRGVAFANARRGDATDLAALRAYNDAIAMAPRDIDPNIRARLFGYRGAILKRLGRLDEAEADLLLAKSYATRKYEFNDIRYNLAGVYALCGNREKLMEVVHELKDEPDGLALIRLHLDSYFRDFRNDQEFLCAIDADEESR